MKVLNKLVRLMKQNRLLIVVGMFYLIAYVLKPDFIITAFDNSKYYIIEMAKIMPIIFVITIGIEAFVPKKTIEDNLGEGSALKGIFFSLLLGSLSAGPIYAAFPVCKTLLKKRGGGHQKHSHNIEFMGCHQSTNAY